jgi:hypothetical protein
MRKLNPYRTATSVPPVKSMDIGDGKQYLQVNLIMSASNDQGNPILNNWVGVVSSRDCRSRLIARLGVFGSRRRNDSNRRTFKPLCYGRTHTSTEFCVHYLEVIEFAVFEARWAVVVVAHLVIFRSIKAGDFAV